MTDDPKNQPGDGSEDNPDGYKIGPGKPPKHTRWQKGQSGNPSGKRKQPESCRDLLKEEMDALVQVRENGKPMTLTMRRAWVKSVVNGTIMGNPDDERITMMFEKPEESPRKGTGLRIIDVDDEDEIPR